MKVHLINLLLLLRLLHVLGDEYEDNVKFVLYNNGQKSISRFNKTISEQGCDVNGKFSLIIHGWLGSDSPWIFDLVSNLTQYRTGCIIFMNYSYYSDQINYFGVISHFEPLSKLLTKKLRHLRDGGVSSDNMFIFGFSFGGRIAIEGALNYGPKRISQIDTCDMAGPGFDVIYRKDPKGAAKNVQCIHTSIDAGTKERNCHQDWLMGHCGKTQDAAVDYGPFLYCQLQQPNNCSRTPLFSHNLCPYFYNAAFKHDFIVKNNDKCSSERMAKNLPANFKMGFMETRKNSSFIGDIPSPTSKFYPYNGV